MRTSASTPTVTHSDHLAAAAYLMKHAGVTALVVLDGERAGRPVGVITKADIARAVPGERAGLIAAIFIVSYVAFSVPVVVAGVATTHVGLHRTALVYCAVIAVLAAAAAAGLIFRRRSAAGGTAQPGEGETP